MTKDEELKQLRAEKTVLCEALRRKDEELEQSHQANQDLREGLKQAIMAIEYLHERVKALEGQQAKDSHNSSLPPSSDRFVRPPRACGKRAGSRLEGKKAIVGTTSSRWRSPIRYSFIRWNAVSTASTTCVSNQQICQSGA